VRCVCLVKAIGNGVSEVGEIGVVFRVKDEVLAKPRTQAEFC
jgi:hypothetical protein